MKVFLGVLLALLAVVALWLWQVKDAHLPAKPGDLPWQVTVSSDGLPQVFGLTIGQDSLAQARQLFGEDAKIGIIARQDEEGQGQLEMFYTLFNRAGLSGKLVLVADVAAPQLLAWRSRASRREILSNASSIFHLNADDAATAQQQPIQRIVFAPSVRLQTGMVTRLFGQPDHEITTAEGSHHLLYMEKGVVIEIHPKGKDFIHYQKPAEMPLLLTKLQALSADL